MRADFWDIGYEDSATIPWIAVLAILAGVVLAIWLVAKVNRLAAKTIAITLAVLLLASLGADLALSILTN